MVGTSRSNAVSRMTGGMRFADLRRRASVSKPSMSGIMMSSSTTANVCRSQRSSASKPDAAETTSTPSGSSTALSARRFAGLSSTARIDDRCLVPLIM